MNPHGNKHQAEHQRAKQIHEREAELMNEEHDDAFVEWIINLSPNEERRLIPQEETD